MKLPANSILYPISCLEAPKNAMEPVKKATYHTTAEYINFLC